MNVSTCRNVFIAALGALGLIITVCVLQIFRYNNTDSVPKGIYVRTFGIAKVGSTVFLQIPAEYESVDSYLRKYPNAFSIFTQGGYGSLQTVVAAHGDVFCKYRNNEIAINDVYVANAKEPAQIGVIPPPKWYGCRTLTSGEIAVVAQDPDSSDSRYFSLVEKSKAKTYALLVRMS